MATDRMLAFSRRSRQIVNANRRARLRGSELHLGPDGLLTVRPRRGSTGLPFRGLFILLALLFGAKALMLAHDGPTTYGERLATLAQGGPAERAGAFAMQADPLTVLLADQLRPLLR